MPAPTPQAITTVEELLSVPDDGMRHELLDGEHVVTLAPSLVHQLVLRRLYDALQPAFGRGLLCLLWSPADIRLGRRTLVQPDLFAVRLPENLSQARWTDLAAPLLAIEVLSASTAWRDRGRKRRLYLSAGVEEYWIVDIDARLIERWHVGDDKPEMVDTELRWALGDGASGTVDVAQLFEGLGTD